MYERNTMNKYNKYEWISEITTFCHI